jgi:hypothetical protein
VSGIRTGCELKGCFSWLTSRTKCFPLAVETRAPLLKSSGANARRRETMEREWARRRGILEDVLFAGSMTDSTSPQETSSPTWTGTDTENGNDVHSDQTTDSETTEISDDLKNDDPF